VKDAHSWAFVCFNNTLVNDNLRNQAFALKTPLGGVIECNGDLSTVTTKETRRVRLEVINLSLS